MKLAPALRRLLLTTLLLACIAPVPAAKPPLPAPPEGRVIVKFKADAAALRVHALAARPDGAALRQALAGRASLLGARTGRVLTAGAVVGERTQVVKASGIGAAALAAELAALPDVESAEPDGRVRRAAAPTDPLYASVSVATRSNGIGTQNGPLVGQWYLRAPLAGSVMSAIDAEAAWARTMGVPSVVVAVLDTGVRRDHPDLAGARLLGGYDFISDVPTANDNDGRDADASDPGDYTTAAENSDPNGDFYQCDPSGLGRPVLSPSSWHGTATASLVGATANNGVGMAGTAPGVSILPVRVLGKCGGFRSDIIAAMRWAVGIPVDGVPSNPNPAKVLNMSLGGDLTCSTQYQSAVDDVLAAGAVIVASAGNGDGGPEEAPANCDGVIGVAAVRHAGTKVDFSSIGPKVVISAPGGNCPTGRANCSYPLIAASNNGSTVPGTSTWFDSTLYEVGTSFSAPLVAGTAALMFSVQPGLSPTQLRNKLASTARPWSQAIVAPGVPQCAAPVEGVEQAECACTTTTCGAGMLDAGAAVAAAAVPTPVARITVTPASPTAGSAITFSASTSTPSSGNTITGYEWTLTNGGGIVPNIANGATIATSVTATLTPNAAGSFTVTLAVSDGGGNTGLASQTVTVAAATSGGGSPLGGGNSGGGGGGGAFSWPWLALLALATAVLFSLPPRRA